MDQFKIGYMGPTLGHPCLYVDMEQKLNISQLERKLFEFLSQVEYKTEMCLFIENALSNQQQLATLLASKSVQFVFDTVVMQVDGTIDPDTSILNSDVFGVLVPVWALCPAISVKSETVLNLGHTSGTIFVWFETSGSDEQLEYIVSCLSKIQSDLGFSLNRNGVYLTPNIVDSEETIACVAKACMHYGWMFNPRIYL